MVYDHWLYFGERDFAASSLPIIDAILSYFNDRKHVDLQLVTNEERTAIWNFHDWCEEWRPYGSPPTAV